MIECIIYQTESVRSRKRAALSLVRLALALALALALTGSHLSSRSGAMTPNPNVMNALAAAAAASFAVFAVVIGSRFVPPASLYAWHPALMSAAIALCGASSSLAVRARAIAPGKARLRAFWTHLALNVLGVVCWTSGAYAIYANKSANGKPHLTSTHGFVGAVGTVALVCADLLGVASFNALGVLARFDLTRYSARVKSTHRLAGHIAFVLGVVAASMRTDHPSIGYSVSARMIADFSLWGGVLALGFAALTTPEWNRVK